MAFTDKNKEKEYKRKYYLDNIDKISKQHKEYYKKHVNNRYKLVQSVKKYNKDFSPIQNGLYSLNHSQASSYTHNRVAAVPKSFKSNKYSTRKGVTYEKQRNRWRACLQIKGNRYSKHFKTEKEAIAYREYLENTYYTKEQLRIRNKFSK